MLHEVKLIFGYCEGAPNYAGSITVSPRHMLTLLSKPFADWLYKKNWPAVKVQGLDYEKYRIDLCEAVEHLNDEYFSFDFASAHWLGFRVSLDQGDAEAEFVFCVDRITGEIRPNIDKISSNLVSELLDVRSTVNRMLSGVKRTKSFD